MQKSSFLYWQPFIAAQMVSDDPAVVPAKFTGGAEWLEHLVSVGPASLKKMFPVCQSLY